MSTFHTLARASLILGFGVAACGRADRMDADSSAAATMSPGGMTDSAAGTVGTMSESQIVEAVMAANAMDSAHGSIAAQRASNAEVKEFGRMMVRDHGALNKQVAELAGRINVSPTTTVAPMSDTAALQGRSGADFDRAYIDSEVTMHQDVLNRLDRELIPSATNSELRTLLEQARGSVQAHLDRARQLQETLGAAK